MKCSHHYWYPVRKETVDFICMVIQSTVTDIERFQFNSKKSWNFEHLLIFKALPLVCSEAMLLFAVFRLLVSVDTALLVDLDWLSSVEILLLDDLGWLSRVEILLFDDLDWFESNDRSLLVEVCDALNAEKLLTLFLTITERYVMFSSSTKKWKRSSLENYLQKNTTTMEQTLNK